MSIKTVRRNATKKIEEIFANAKDCKAYSLQFNFEDMEVSAELIRKDYEKTGFAKLLTDGNGSYTVRIHSNQWYNFQSI